MPTTSNHILGISNVERRVLIVAPPDDFHGAAVGWALQQYGVVVCYLSDLSAPERSRHRSMQAETTGIELLENFLDVPQFTSIWRRRLYRRRTAPSPHTADSQFVYMESETFDKDFIDSICATRTHVCVNERYAEQRAENKQMQLIVASRSGLAIPPTLISQNPDLIRKFVLGQKSCVVKAQTGQVWSNATAGKVYTTSTNILPKNRLSEPFFDESCAICPAIYQGHINKVSDLRVVVFGENIESVEIVSNEESTSVDCRTAINKGQVSALRFPLDDTTATCIRKMCAHFGIQYASMDFAREETGRLVFLDLNPAGQFLFAEDLCPETQLLDKFARYLAGDIPANKSKPATLSAFVASRSGADWIRSWGHGRPRNSNDDIMMSYES